MGRGCSCCSKDSRSCCPENVFLDDDSAIALYVLYTHQDEDKNINIEFETDFTGRSVVYTLNAKKDKLYYLRFVFAKEGSVSLDKSPICDLCPPPISNPKPNFVTNLYSLTEFFDQNLSRHKLFVWVGGTPTTGPSGTINGPMPVVNFSSALYCVKKYSGDPDYIYNEQAQQSVACKAYSYLLSPNVYYNSATYNYDGKYWTNNGKYGCICACNDITTTSLPDYEVEDNIGITFDECGVVDGLINNAECLKVLHFTVTSKSQETGRELVCYNTIEFGPFQAIYTVQCDNENQYQFVRPLLFNERYLPPYATILKPFSDNDIITVTIDFSYEHIDCEGFLGCENCGSSREACFCFKDSYSLSHNVFTLRYTEPCLLTYSNNYIVNIHRTYRSRNISKNFTKFTLTISNIYIDWNPPFWTEECKESYRNLIKSLEGSYVFNLANDGCGNFTEFNPSREIIRQSSFPCRCFSGGGYTGDLNLDLYKHSYNLGVGTCRGLAPNSSNFSDGVISGTAEGSVGYSLRGEPSDDSGCFVFLGSFFPVANSNIGLQLKQIDFIFQWISGFCNTITQLVNQKISYCKGCEYTDKDIDFSSIRYKLSDLVGGSTTFNFDCDLEGVFS